MGTGIYVVLALAGFLFFLQLFVLPEVRAARQSPCYGYGVQWLRKRSYLVQYLVFGECNILLGFFMMNFIVPNAGGFDLSFIVAMSAISVLSLVVIVVTISWISRFFSTGWSSLFQDLYLANVDIQDIVRPFMWLLIGISALMDLPAVLLHLLVPTRTLSYSTPLSWIEAAVGNVTFFSFIFMVGVRRMRLFRIGICIIAGAAAYSAFLTVLVGAATVVITDNFASLHDDENPIDLASSVITNCVFSYVFYRFFLSADTRKVIQESGS
jgi:hypothetical protein